MSNRGKTAACAVCETSFVQRHAKHTTCGAESCVAERNRRVHMNWRYSTGRTSPKENLWSNADREFLRNNRFMSTKEVAERLSRSVDSVREKRGRMKLPQLSLCVTCGAQHQTINQHNTCATCVPNQQETARNYKNGLNGRWIMYRQNAKRRNLAFDLSIEQFAAFWQKPCSYCAKEIPTVGIDRVDSRLGYVTGNLVACCSRCNESKNDASTEEWVAHMKAVLRHLGQLD